MRDITKYHGIIPALYACYDSKGSAISPRRVRDLVRHLADKGVNGLYVGGSSGECIYQSVDERKLLLENVIDEAKGKLLVIAHVACNNTADSRELAAHAESLGVDAIAAIPPIYFHLPEHSVARYWNDISNAAPNTDFIIYNIPQLAGVALTLPLLRQMLHNPRVIGVKNSSMSLEDIRMWCGEGAFVFNGPDEQLVSGLNAGAVGGIGGTYGAMPELYLKIVELQKAGELAAAESLQQDCCRIIEKMCSAYGHMYAVIKELLRKFYGLDCGGVRCPLENLAPDDTDIVDRCAEMIQTAISTHCKYYGGI